MKQAAYFFKFDSQKVAVKLKCFFFIGDNQHIILQRSEMNHDYNK